MMANVEKSLLGLLLVLILRRGVLGLNVLSLHQTSLLLSSSGLRGGSLGKASSTAAPPGATAKFIGVSLPGLLDTAKSSILVSTMWCWGGKPHPVGGTLQPWIGKQCMEMEVPRQSFSPFDAAEPNGFSRLPFTAGNRQVSVSSSSVAAQKGNYRVLTSA